MHHKAGNIGAGMGTVLFVLFSFTCFGCSKNYRLNSDDAGHDADLDAEVISDDDADVQSDGDPDSEGDGDPDGDPDDLDDGDLGDEVGDGACDRTSTDRVTLPADDSVHPDLAEWWYWTGHLQTSDGRWFGFQQVFFRVSYMGMSGQMVHHAITDIDDGSFHHTHSLIVGAPANVVDGFNFSVVGLTASGGNGRDVIHGAVDRYELDLTLEATKAPVFQYADGYTDYPFGGYTYYYSRERMAAEGTLVADGEPLAVTGWAWFDHQWGDLAVATGLGWDWFALQLDDNREIMVFVIRTSGEDALISGSLTDADCRTTELASEDIDITSLDTWHSTTSGCSYPSGWTIRALDVSVTVTPVLVDQELPTGYGGNYWEGAAEVSGDATGRAYIELTGYCNDF